MKEKNRKGKLVAWLLTIAMVFGLLVVPGGRVEAETTSYPLTVMDNVTSVAIAVNPYPADVSNPDYIGDVLFDIPSEAAGPGVISSNNIVSVEVKLTVDSFTAGAGTPSAMLFLQPGADGDWQWNNSDSAELAAGQQITLTYDFSNMNWNGGSSLEKLGIRFAGCSDGSTVSFTIDSAKLITSDSTGGGITEPSGETSDKVTATVHSVSINAPDWSEYNYSVTNGLNTPISNMKIKIPVTGSISNFKPIGCNAKYSGGYIIITRSVTLNAGATYTCPNDVKFGFGGTPTFGTPVVEFAVGENAGGTSGKKIDDAYRLTGQTKNIPYEETPFGKHGELKLSQVAGYSAPIIVDESGEPFQLRGASTHGMHWDEMHPYVNKAAFQSLRDEWGVNMIRLVSYVTQDGYTEGKGDFLDTKIQEGVEAATELGMYVLIDWHIHDESPIPTQTAAEAFFAKYAEKYKDYKNVIFEICNEPTKIEWYNGGTGNDLYSYCKDIVGIIRSKDSNALVVCGTNTFSQDVDDVAKKPLKNDGYDNVLYTFHFYAASHYDNLMDKVKKATAAGTPIFVTEFGVCSANGNGEYDLLNADNWIALCDQYNISYACWSLCNKAEAASYLKTDCTKTQGGWVESDLTTTGIWLVNTYRKHEEAENGQDPGPSGGEENPDNPASGDASGNGTENTPDNPASGDASGNGTENTPDNPASGDASGNGTENTPDNPASGDASGNGTENTPDNTASGDASGNGTENTPDNTASGSGTENTSDKPDASGDTPTSTDAGESGDKEFVKATSMRLYAKVKGAADVPISSAYKLAVKKTMELKVELRDSVAANFYIVANATGSGKNDEPRITFTSSKPGVATVSDTGIITAKKAGTTTITVKTADGLSKSFKLQVMRKPVTKVKITGAKASMKVKGNMKLKAVISPNKKLASNKVCWKSSNKKIAIVDSAGRVRALKKGTVKITAAMTDGSGKKATVKIKVK